MNSRHVLQLFGRVLLLIHSLMPMTFPPVVAGDATDGVLPFTEARVISGTAQQRGEQYGTALAGQIREFYEAEILKPFAGKVGTPEELLEFAGQCGEVIREECPIIAAELDGIASGSGLSFNQLVLINLHEELYHRQPLPTYSHCTAVALGPGETGAGTLVGQTWDWMQSVAGKSSLLEWQREDGASVLAYGFPGMPFGAGMNSHGIALVWTSAALGTKGVSPRVGLPSYVLIAHLLNQPNIDSVIRVAERNRHAGWFTFVMADGHGNLVNLEGSPNGISVERAATSLVRIGYGTAKMAGTKPGEPIPQHARCEKLLRLLESTHGRTSRALLEQYFTDPKHQIHVGKSTIDMMIFDTTNRTARISRGPAYGVAWRDFKFTKP